MSKQGRTVVNAFLSDWSRNEKHHHILGSIEQLKNLINPGATMTPDQAMEFGHMLDTLMFHVKRRARPLRVLEMLTLATYANGCQNSVCNAGPACHRH